MNRESERERGGEGERRELMRQPFESENVAPSIVDCWIGLADDPSQSKIV